MKYQLLLIATVLVVGCASHTPQVHVQPIIEANKKTKVAIKKTQEHHKQLQESQTKVSGSLQGVMEDLNKLLIP